MSGLRIFYLLMTVVGAVVPMLYFNTWFALNGFSVPGLFAAWQVNAATKGLGLDLLLTGTALTVWIVAETRVRGNWSALWAIPATFLIGVSCGLPLYLFLRTRPV